MLDSQSSLAQQSRRVFLQTATAGAFAAGLSLEAAEPIQRTGQPYFKLSLAAYSFRQLLTQFWPARRGQSGKLTLFDFIDFCAAQNLAAVELTSYFFPNPLPTETLLQIKEKTFRLGLDISGTAIGNDFCLPDGADRDAQLAMCRQWIDYAAAMGAPVIRIFAGKIPKGSTEEQALNQCVSGIEKSLEYAAQKGVSLALENHGGITGTPEQLLSIVKRVGTSPWFGVNFDSGNFRTEDPYGDLAKIAPYAINAQIKVAMNPAGQDEQPADYKRIIEILKSAGYRGYLVLEYEEAQDPREAIPPVLKELRALLS